MRNRYINIYFSCIKIPIKNRALTNQQSKAKNYTNKNVQKKISKKNLNKL